MNNHNKNFHYSHNKLISWSTPRCDRCGRFLKKTDRKHCSECRPKIMKEQNSRLNKVNRVKRNDYLKSWREKKRLSFQS